MKKYKFFSHVECEFFPCHKLEGSDLKREDFNCLFCYCPLYALGKNCGGNFSVSESGVKDCTNCLLPHRRDNYEYIISKFREIVEVTKIVERMGGE
ncbi:cysteine-rich small domain-containing protein [Peptostreptococcus porci]|uniref:cysteine-rich small domain-containing protein n=1 Tax=Peptostreptococcus porci TaxID=2652282 RepID=UPI002A91DAA1|nr:cysteine-rich small domain-containing protein [Peptostreptococcus porci]MDY5436173.1 cysteine-rich small domain-containing protein [Peptostreptococcus porci]